MNTLKSTIDAINSFCHSVKLDGVIEDFVFAVKEVEANNNENNLAVQKALQILLTELTSLQNPVKEMHQSEGSSDMFEGEKKGRSETPPKSPLSEETSEDGEQRETNERTFPDENLVQIKVDRQKVNQRISAYIKRKRKEVDVSNSIEFCNNFFLEDQNPLNEESNSCARVDAIFVPRYGCKSHVTISRVENNWGPQEERGEEQPQKSSTSQVFIKQEPTENNPLNSAGETFDDMEARLLNLESHMKIKKDDRFRKSIYTRLKELEDRILFLEGLSPNYFYTKGMSGSSPKKKLQKEKEKVLCNSSVEELQRRMQQLKEELKFKAIQNKTFPFMTYT